MTHLGDVDIPWLFSLVLCGSQERVATAARPSLPPSTALGLVVTHVRDLMMLVHDVTAVNTVDASPCIEIIICRRQAIHCATFLSLENIKE